MMEKEVRRVMMKYFTSKNVEIIPQSGAGPDLHIRGKGVVETKGTRYNFSDLVKQLVDYARKYPEIALALPFDGLDLKRAEQLNTVEWLIEQVFRGVFKLYVIVPDNNVFYVRDFKRVGEAVAKMTIGMVGGFNLQNPLPELEKVVQRIIDYSPAELLKKNIVTTLDQYTSKIVL